VRFFRGQGEGMELKGLQKIAICRNLWCGREEGRDVLRESLWMLKERGVLEVIVVPDDDRGPLIDRWYYGKHDIELLDPEWAYSFRPSGQEMDGKTVVENLGEWFERLWKLETDRDSARPVLGVHQSGVGGDQVFPRIPPSVTAKSIRRNGRRMAPLKDGLWDIQKAMGDMRVWKSWTPPERP
jgi:hypothetical protein